MDEIITWGEIGRGPKTRLRERTLFVICVIENTLSKEYRYIFKSRNKIMNYCHEFQWKSFKRKEIVSFLKKFPKS